MQTGTVTEKGRHQVTHYAGRDWSKGLKDAPHGPEMLDKFPIVGILVESN